MQMMLIWLVLSDAKGLDNIYNGTWQLNSSRLICAFLLHMSIVPEIKCALDLMKYAKFNKKTFYRQNEIYPTMIGMMKLMGGMTTELVNIFIIIQSYMVSDVLKDFIAFGVIA